MTAPKLRFKEFDGDWTKYKIAEATEYLVDGTHFSPKSTDGEFKYITSKNIRNDGLDLTNISYISKDEHESIYKRCKVQLGDILLTKDGANTGNCCLNTLDEEFSLLSSVAVLRGKKQSFDNKFILQILQSDLGQNTIVSSMSGQAITRITLTKLKDYSFHFPEFTEQTKIATFLSAVDEKISQLSQKLHLLSQYKQGMMQKLFSQQLRFKADDGSEFAEWEDKRISEIASYRRGSFPQPYGLPEWLDENGFPFVQVYDVADNMLLKDKTKIKISQLAANQSVFAKTGTLIITIQGSIGRVAKMQYDAYVDRTLLIFQSYSMPINTDYFKYALYLLFNIEKEKADGGIIKTITKETLSKFNIGIPCLEEQTKIANFLSAIDQKIDVVSEQLEQAKLWKKGLLQQMFV